MCITLNLEIFSPDIIELIYWFLLCMNIENLTANKIIFRDMFSLPWHLVTLPVLAYISKYGQREQSPQLTPNGHTQNLNFDVLSY